MIRLDPVLCFFMSRHETEALFKSWLAAHELYCVISRHFPFEHYNYHSDDDISLADFEVAWLDLSPFPQNARDGVELSIANRESLQIRFPIEIDSALIMGTLGSLARTGPSAKLWSSFAKQLCSITKDGMWLGINSRSEFLPAPKVRYSEEAQKMHVNGIRLRTGIGSTGEYFPDKPSTMT
jgi:hypothetical protein